jgi:hypothetical protein
VDVSPPAHRSRLFFRAVRTPSLPAHRSRLFRAGPERHPIPFPPDIGNALGYGINSNGNTGDGSYPEDGESTGSFGNEWRRFLRDCVVIEVIGDFLVEVADIPESAGTLLADEFAAYSTTEIGAAPRHLPSLVREVVRKRFDVITSSTGRPSTTGYLPRRRLHLYETSWMTGYVAASGFDGVTAWLFVPFSRLGWPRRDP